MKISVTIPQVFYDVIARVLPGYLFLFAINCEVDLRILRSLSASARTSVDAVLNGIGYTVLSYFMGWVLLAGTVGSLRKRVMGEIEGAREPQQRSPSLREMFHRIRIKHPGEGFRILKLRAEARMIETSRTAMCCASVVGIFGLLFGKSPLFGLSGQSHSERAAKIVIPLIAALAFRRCERRTWRNYFGNIPVTYKILFHTRVAKVTPGLSSQGG